MYTLKNTKMVFKIDYRLMRVKSVAIIVNPRGQGHLAAILPQI